MKKNKLILGTFLTITAIFFSGCGASSSSDSTSKVKVKSSAESTESGGEVTIGTQVWTSKNLDVATYRNGDVIPEVQDPKAWANLTTGAWCYYDNNASNGKKYGKLYNWYAVHDPRGLAPEGYHIPTDAEWTKLSDYLGGESEAGTKMKSTSGWIGNGSATNSSGFSGLPGGFRISNGTFYSIGFVGGWSSSSEDGARYFIYYILNSNYDTFGRLFDNKLYGFSVRCLRD